MSKAGAAATVHPRPAPASPLTRTSSPSFTPTPRAPLRVYARTLATLNDTRAELAASLAKLESMLPPTSDESFIAPATSPTAPAH